MRSIGSIVAATGMLATALTFAGAPPAEAGRACNELGLRSPCINSSDLKARLNLDEDGKHGRLQVRDADRENAVQLNAATATVTNLFSNAAGQSNGLVKAWARINVDGTIAACWRCNTDPNQTRRLDTGTYVVDFTPLATDITGRPRAVTLDTGGFLAPNFAVIRSFDYIEDASSVVVFAHRANTEAFINTAFTLLIY